MEDILNGKIKRKELSKWLDEVKEKFERKREERLKEERARIFGDLKP
jgi:hypothetical protein